MIEYCDQFLRKIEVIKLYLAEFKEDKSMKLKDLSRGLCR